LLPCRLGGGGVEINARDLGARLGESERDGAPDAGARAGDDRIAARQGIDVAHAADSGTAAPDFEAAEIAQRSAHRSRDAPD
jgi:hypothetical protein